MRPVVTVICISYNHAPYIKEALESLFNQTYDNLEIIIADDASTDLSQEHIKNYIQGKEQIQLIAHQTNLGYTRTFNEAFVKATGDFIVDFALDDVMEPDFIESGINRFEEAGNSFGVTFSNANYINQESELIGNHNEILRGKGLLNKVPQGDIFEMVLKRYFICTPSMIIRKSVLDRLGGYDENLAYEDFDFWVRSSRFIGYAYIDKTLIHKRKLTSSMSAQQYKSQENQQLEATLKVCRKALHLCKTQAEHKALIERVRYELGQCLTSKVFDIGEGFYDLLKSLKENSLRLLIYKTLLAWKMNYQFLNKKRKKGLV